MKNIWIRVIAAHKKLIEKIKRAINKVRDAMQKTETYGRKGKGIELNGGWGYSATIHFLSGI
jgi:hypothetical protein